MPKPTQKTLLLLFAAGGAAGPTPVDGSMGGGTPEDARRIYSWVGYGQLGLGGSGRHSYRHQRAQAACGRLGLQITARVSRAAVLARLGQEGYGGYRAAYQGAGRASHARRRRYVGAGLVTVRGVGTASQRPSVRTIAIGAIGQVQRSSVSGRAGWYVRSPEGDEELLLIAAALF